MSGQLRTKRGCWTCRTRRKKCSEKGFPCSTCTSLSLDCYGYGARPDWMDGGPRERAQASTFKDIVKRNTSSKRQVRIRDGAITRRVQRVFEEVMPLQRPHESSIHHCSHKEVQIHIDPLTYQLPALPWPAETPKASQPQQAPIPHTQIRHVHRPSTGQSECSSILSNTVDQLPELPSSPECLMFNVLTTPISTISDDLNPFDSIEGFMGLQDHELALNEEQPFSQDVLQCINYPTCSSVDVSCLADKTLTFHDSTLESTPQATDVVSGVSLQNSCDLQYYLDSVFPDLVPFMTSGEGERIGSHISSLPKSSWPLLCALVMQGSYCRSSQLKMFGFVTSSTEAASVMSENIVTEVSQSWIASGSAVVEKAIADDSVADLAILVTQLLLLKSMRGDSDWQKITPLIHSLEPLNAGEEAMKDSLYLTLNQDMLTHLDILACTAAGTEPKFAWKMIHNPKLASATVVTYERDSPIGIPNWVTSCLVQIAFLRCWKEKQLSLGSLSFAELVRKADEIEKNLETHRQANQEHLIKQGPSAHGVFTAVYAAAASVYLHTTISEPRPQVPEIRTAVGAACESLNSLPYPNLLKRLAWPVCVVASLAETSHQDFFRNLLDRVVQIFGSSENISRALLIARECWKLRNNSLRESYTYDWTDAMKSMGKVLILY